MEPTNFLVILSDEHTRGALGCYGHPLVKTPNLDRLAARGTRFVRAYSNSPLCVPSRSVIATGRHVHETRCWDNGHPFEGRHTSWARRLRDGGHQVVSIGKLHYRDSRPETGFSEEILPMHVRYGVGDLLGMLRVDPPSYGKVPASLSREAGPGESNHTEYDRLITDAACDWLRNRVRERGDRPWVLFVSLVSPHFPLIAPERFYGLYPLDRIDMPRFYAKEERPTHPAMRAIVRAWNYDDFFTEETVRKARAGYYGLCSFLDDNIGRVLGALEDAGFADTTRVAYTSDHGEMLGNRGIWSTSVMYEESVGIPMMLAGPGIPAEREVNAPVSLVDLYPTLVEAAGSPLSGDEQSLPGHSLIDIANGARPERTVLSEYHAGGSITGFFMIRHARWKYVHYVNYPPQLFDLESDPDEAHDLGESPAHAEVREACLVRLRQVVEPEAASAAAFRDQEATIERHGGVEAVLARGHPGEHPLDRPLFEVETP